MMETSGSAIVSTPRSARPLGKLRRIAKLAREMPGAGLNTLAHHIDMDWMREAFRRTLDQERARPTARARDDTPARPEGRGHDGRAPNVRRVHIPKGRGRETRPLGIPTFEDKVLQRAVVMALEAVYEQDFLDCSYGFRPGRSAHSALAALRREIMDMSGGWVLEVDIRGFFDTIDHAKLGAILRQRIRDGVLLRLIGKWLPEGQVPREGSDRTWNAGVLEAGEVTYPQAGTPQGGVISPLLANVFLHEVVDTWFEHTVKPRLEGRARLVRYADDMVFHDRSGGNVTRPPGPTPTAGMPWRDGSAARRRRRARLWPTAADRFSRALRRVAEWCRTHRHHAVKEQWRALCLKLKGHFGYYGITGNSQALDNFRYRVRHVWRKWLSRRSQTAHIEWDRFALLERRYPLPPARVARPLSVT